MGVYTGFVDGYKQETTYGDSIITAQADVTYLWGAIGQKSVHPSPKTSMIYRATGVNAQEVEAGALWKGREVLTGMYNIGMQNGIPLWAIMGKSSTAGADPYTHTITPAGTTGGAIDLLPSFTVQHELSGTATDYQIQFLGMKMSSLTLVTGFEERILAGAAEWIAKSAVKGAVGALTNAPILPPTASEAPYHFNNLTRTWDYGDTAVALDGLQYMEFTISADMMPEYAHAWDGATYVGRQLKSLIEGTRKLYTLKMRLHQPSSVIWEELVGTSNTEDMYFKWTRDTNDYIEMNLTDCWVTSHEIITPEIGQPLVEEVIIEPRAVSFTVKDSIAGGYYGE